MTTIYEIAKRAGVSIATISRAINPETRSKVSPETLKHVEDLIAKCHYTPNFSAKFLTKQSYKTIGVIIPHLEGIFFSDYYSKILSGVSDGLMNTGYILKLILFKVGMPKYDYYNFRAGEGIDGLIVTQWPMYFSGKKILEGLKLPTIFITDPLESTQANFISADNRMGGEIAARYLYSKGHRKIIVVTGPQWSSDSQLRLKGFMDYMKKKGLHSDPSMILCGNYQKKKASEVVGEYLNKKTKATAIFCLNDFMALGVLDRLNKLGFSCPKDFSVMGYDDERGSRYANPPLTTIHMPFYEIAREAATQMTNYLDSNKSDKNVNMPKPLVSVGLVERHSVISI